MGEPHVLIWAVPKDTFGERISLHERMYRAAHNETILNCYEIDDEAIHRWIHCINARRPTLIETYADAIYEVSRRIISEGVDVAKPRGIITSAGVLTTHKREVITEAFNCPVLNRYGSREVSDVACSCLSSSELHVNEFSCYLEIVDDQGEACEVGVEGDILVTLFTNYTMPLIRYQIKDRGIWASGPCACGRKTRRLAEISGRQSDYLLASDGTKVNGTALTTLLYSVTGIGRFQYRQTHENKVVLAVVPLQRTDVGRLKDEVHSALERLKTLLHGSDVELAIVDKIIPSKSGKYRYILNELMDR